MGFMNPKESLSYLWLKKDGCESWGLTPDSNPSTALSTCIGHPFGSLESKGVRGK
jgi:hypothetical protein